MNAPKMYKIGAPIEGAQVFVGDELQLVATVKGEAGEFNRAGCASRWSWGARPGHEGETPEEALRDCVSALEARGWLVKTEPALKQFKREPHGGWRKETVWMAVLLPPKGFGTFAFSFHSAASMTLAVLLKRQEGVDLGLDEGWGSAVQVHAHEAGEKD